MDKLTKGCLKQVPSSEQQHDGPLVLGVCSLRAEEQNGGKKLQGRLTDGESSVQCAFSTRCNAHYEQKQLQLNSIISISRWHALKEAEKWKVMVLEMEVVEKSCQAVSELPGAQEASTQASDGTARASLSAPVSPSEVPCTPPMRSVPTSVSGPQPPSTGPAIPTPPSMQAWAPRLSDASENSARAANSAPAAASAAQPISSLNPYREKWTIEVKVDSKIAKSATISGVITSILEVVLTDSAGTQIQGTFWRETADKADRELQEGKVYSVSNGRVMPANKRYAAVQNDYKISFNDRTEFSEVKSKDSSQMKARYNFIKVDCLEQQIGKKNPVDVVAVVTQVGSLGSIKRQNDGSEIPRRDITLVDQTRKTVTLTLWRQQAEEVGAQLEKVSNPVAIFTRLRVNEYNGVSLSATQMTRVEVQPSGHAEADALAEWWQSEGSSMTFTQAGDGAARPGLQRLSKYHTLDQLLREDETLSESDPPVYATVHCVLTKIPENQNLYYEANPDSNKKVEKNPSGSWVEVSTGASSSGMVRRYIVNAMLTDFTTEGHINIFNEQAQQVLGMTADALHAAKEASEDTFANALTKSTWSEWVLDVVAKPREYKGKTSMRINCRTLRKRDYDHDSSKLLQMISEHVRAQ